jgi:hypothetical protein
VNSVTLTVPNPDEHSHFLTVVTGAQATNGSQSFRLYDGGQLVLEPGDVSGLTGICVRPRS